MKIIKADINFKEEYRRRFNAPMFGDLNKREMLIFRTGLKNGVSLGRSSIRPQKIYLRSLKALTNTDANLPKNIACDKKLIDIIFQAASKFYKVTAAGVLGKTRKREFVIPRSIIINLLRELTPLSLSLISQTINRDHTTVLHHIQSKCDRKVIWKYNTLYHQYEQIKKDIQKLHNK
jgi:chromosomal replication initiation ATPase DnaA|tara:strand:- start:226 stop:756 length:531 start_codon:yes stop_codon:yes gene_type:complete